MFSGRQSVRSGAQTYQGSGNAISPNDVTVDIAKAAEKQHRQQQRMHARRTALGWVRDKPCVCALGAMSSTCVWQLLTLLLLPVATDGRAPLVDGAVGRPAAGPCHHARPAACLRHSALSWHPALHAGPCSAGACALQDSPGTCTHLTSDLVPDADSSPDMTAARRRLSQPMDHLACCFNSAIKT